MTGAGEFPPLDTGSASKAAVDVISVLSKALLDVQKEAISDLRETIKDLRKRNDELSKAQVDYVDQAEQLKEAKDELEEHYTTRHRHEGLIKQLNAKIKQLDDSLAHSQQQVQQQDKTIQGLQRIPAQVQKQRNVYDSDEEISV